MKHVRFKLIEITNFLSCGEQPIVINFDDFTGINIITGTNLDKPDRRNGVGKSMVVDAIHFALYGTTIRKLKKTDIPNNLTKGKSQVSLVFEVVDSNTKLYKVVRTLSPSSVEIFEIVAGKDKNKTRDQIKNTTLSIEQLINCDSELFINSIVWTLNNTVPFMAKGNSEKKKFIETILKLSVFTEMSKMFNIEYKQLSKDISANQIRVDEIENSINRLNRQLVDINEQIANSKNAIKQQIDGINSQIEQAQQRIEVVDDELTQQLMDKRRQIREKIEKCDEALDKLREARTQLTAKKAVLQNKIQEIDVDHPKCPKCLTPIGEDEKCRASKAIDILQQRSSEIDDKLSTIKDKTISIKDTESTLSVKIDRISDKITQQSTKKQTNEMLERNIKGLKQQIETVKNTPIPEDTITPDLEKEQKRLKEVMTQYQTDVDQMKVMDVVKVLLSEEGVKSYIVRKVIGLLNQRIRYYLSKLDSQVICHFNEYFDEQIFDEKGKQCSYHNFSGAESKIIDLAIMYAFMDVRRFQGDVCFNILIFDEILDSSLDQKAVETAMDLLHERCNQLNETAFVITHRSEIGGLNINKVINLVKQNHITTLGNIIDNV